MPAMNETARKTQGEAEKFHLKAVSTILGVDVALLSRTTAKKMNPHSKRGKPLRLRGQGGIVSAKAALTQRLAIFVDRSQSHGP
jgi:hypothetical protein